MKIGFIGLGIMGRPMALNLHNAQHSLVVYDRASLPTEATVHGPAIFTELDSTTWLDGDSSGFVHPSGALIVSVS